MQSEGEGGKDGGSLQKSLRWQPAHAGRPGRRQEWKVTKPGLEMELES